MTLRDAITDAIGALVVVLVVPWLAMWGLPILAAIVTGGPA